MHTHSIDWAYGWLVQLHKHTHTTITVAFFVLIETNQMLHVIEMRCAVRTIAMQQKSALLLLLLSSEVMS